MTTRTPLRLAAALLIALPLVTLGLASCSSSGESEAHDVVQTYMNAVAAGDADAALEANPYSLGDATISAAATEHIKVLEVGDWVEAKDVAEQHDDKPFATPSPEATDSSGDDELFGIDWSDDWGTSPDDQLSEADVEETRSGYIVVTYELDGHKTTVPIGVVVAKDSTGASITAFRPVELDPDAAARYKVDTAAPALAPASLVLAKADSATDDTTAATEESLLDKAKDKLADATDAAKDAVTSVTRTVAIGDEKVELSDSEPLQVLPGVYDATVQPDEGSTYFVAPKTPARLVAVAGETVEVPTTGATVTEAGEQAVRDALTDAADTELTRLSTFQPKPSFGVECGALKSDADTLGGALSEDNTKIKVQVAKDPATATPRLGATDRSEAYCTGLYAEGPTVVSSSVTPGEVTVESDGSFTSAPWAIVISTTMRQNVVDSSTAAGSYDATYSATATITWTPTGHLADEGTVQIDGAKRD